jgi:DNA-binding CsgD family transcriptional regulator
MILPPDAENVDPAQHNVLLGGGFTHHGTTVGAMGNEMLGNKIAFGDQMQDIASPVGKCVAEEFGCLARTVGPIRGVRQRRVVIDERGVEIAVNGCQITIGEQGGDADHSSNSGRLPAAIYASAACVQSIDDGTALPEASPTVRVRTINGDWLLVHATHLHGSVEDIAVIIEPAHPSRNAPLVLSSLGLTHREAEVAQLVLRGASTKAIGTELHLSTYTVKDHLKSIFEKTGVRSRRDLVAQILTGHVSVT